MGRPLVIWGGVHVLHPARPPACLVDLSERLPARRGKGRCKRVEAVGGGVTCGPQEPELEAAQASPATFGSGCQGCIPVDDEIHPGGMVVDVIYDGQPVESRITLEFGAPVVILLTRRDVGIAEEERRAYPVVHKALYDRPAARRAAAVKEDFPASARDFQMQHSVIFRKVIKNIFAFFPIMLNFAVPFAVVAKW